MLKLPVAEYRAVAKVVGLSLNGIGPTTSEARAVAGWQPPPGYIGVKTICTDARFRKSGKNPPRSTIDVWIRAAERNKCKPRIVRAPDSQEVHLPEDWVLEQIKRWNPRPKPAT